MILWIKFQASFSLHRICCGAYTLQIAAYDGLVHQKVKEIIKRYDGKVSILDQIIFFGLNSFNDRTSITTKICVK